MNTNTNYTLVALFLMVSLFGQPLSANFIDFDQAMVCNQDDLPRYQTALQNDAETKNFFSFARNQYNQYILQENAFSETPRIPKIIHQIWVGPKTPPKRFKEWQESFLRTHPDWEYRLWTDADVTELNLINQNYYDEETNYGAKSDILRLEILKRFGGVYVDVDFECLQPLDRLHHVCDFYIGFFQVIYLRASARINNGIIAACPEHPLINTLIEEIARNRETHADNLESYHGILERNGPDFVTRIVHEHLPNLPGANIVLPSNYFYPWTGTPKDLELRVQPETIAIHYFASSWDPNVQDRPHIKKQ